ncbi:unnamed protein product [marine sediment metagenome]|uniref:Uncharacterized protein n=1 Tax=marine sediment metagenome TaxID=412755 RepID=X1C933_9ZZZZ
MNVRTLILLTTLALLGFSSSVAFDVTAGNWGINHIGAKGTPGDVAEGDLFPPKTSTEITLTEYKLWAGVGGREKHKPESDHGRVWQCSCQFGGSLVNANAKNVHCPAAVEDFD